ncbi:Hypp2835 [Branchiostoma lanceolatum]|uniref:Hypp2835 protein n=1 Tax=Branchiostoma lanceolatum TaxID=7740 RepID=A0A8K0ES61_BRALA|nr:Hypp2835 [Branchiostoma lanceolatum]
MVIVVSCNFARVAVYTSQHIKQDKKSRFESFRAQFEGHKDFDLEFDRFRRCVDKIDPAFKQWAKCKRPQQQDDLTRYLKHFSPEAWEQLSQSQKGEHQLQAEKDGRKVQCRGCFVRYRDLAESFNKRISKDKVTKTFFETNPVLNATFDPRKADIKEAANQWYQDGDKTFRSFYGVQLAEALVHVPEVQEAFRHQNTVTPVKTVAVNITKNIEQVWQDKNYDVIVHQGTRESDAKYEERRLALNYETTESAKKRARENLAKETTGKLKKRRRVGGAKKWGTWDWESIKQEVASWPNGKEVSWRAYAKEKGVHNKKGEPARNGGQIIQDWLIGEGMNIHRFKTAAATTPRHRRSKKRIQYAESDVCMPVPRSAKKMRQSLSTMIADGEIPIGERIVPKEFDKMVIDKDTGKVKVERFTVEGRKHPLAEVRARTLQEQKKYMRIRTDEEYDEMTADAVKDRLRELGEYREEDCITNMRNKLKQKERTRYISIWEDSSQISNHGHMVYMAHTTYDAAVHLTPEEYEKMNGETVNVQSHVEKPRIHLIARCSSTDLDQLCYCAERRKCIREMNKPLNVSHNGSECEYRDVLRFFKGDLPAREFEAGQQRGGHYPCSCGAHVSRFDDIEYTFRLPHSSFADQIQVLRDGEVTWEKSMNGMSAVDHMSKAELIQELSSRSLLDIHEGKAMPVKDLQAMLKEELHGLKRPPALLFNCPESSLDSLNLDWYEVLPCEPLHDISHHIQNLFDELPFHVPADIRQEIKQVYNATLGNREIKRGCDFRVSLIMLVNALDGKASTIVMELLSSLLEIQRICYLPAEKRSQQEILRLHNQTFLHAMCLRKVIPKPRKLTHRCLYGSYYHSLVTHAPTVFRIVPLSSTHTESEERIFNKLRGIVRTTGSGGNPGQVIGNMLVREFCENKLQADRDRTPYQSSIVSKAARSQRKENEDTFIPSHVISNYPKAWQAHCERISDFLLCGEGVWWTAGEQGVTLHDSSSRPGNAAKEPRILHFRSCSLKTVDKHLRDSWKRCLSEDIVIPLKKLYIYEEDGSLKGIQWTKFLATPNSTETSSENSSESSTESSTENVTENVTENGDDENSSENGAGQGSENLTEEEEEGSEVLAQVQESTDNIPALDQADTCCSQEARRTSHHSHQSTASSVENQSRWTQSLQALLGDIHEVETFDCLRKKMKQQNHVSKETKEKYDKTVAFLQIEVSKCHSVLKTDVEKWERDFMSNHDCACPTLKDIEEAPHVKLLYHNIKIARAVMKAFGMKDF